MLSINSLNEKRKKKTQKKQTYKAHIDFRIFTSLQSVKIFVLFQLIINVGTTTNIKLMINFNLVPYMHILSVKKIYLLRSLLKD